MTDEADGEEGGLSSSVTIWGVEARHPQPTLEGGGGDASEHEHREGAE